MRIEILIDLVEFVLMVDDVDINFLFDKVFVFNLILIIFVVVIFIFKLV